MRILFVSFFFPPYNEMAAVRTGKTAKYLLSFGHDVRVISAQDQSIRGALLPVEVSAERIIYTNWLNPRSPVEKVYGKTQPPPWRGPDPTVFRSTWRGRTVKSLQQWVRTWVYFPDPQIGWFPFAHRAATRLLSKWHPDVIYASAAPATSLLVAHSLARRYSIPWIAEFRDLWTDYHDYAYSGLRRRLEQKLERHILSSAAGFVTVSDPLANTLQRFGKKTIVVLNGFDPSDYSVPEQQMLNREGLRIVYTGTVYAGRQSPDALFAALAGLGPRAEKVRVVFYGTEPYIIHDSARRHGVDHLIEIHPQIPHRQALKAQSEADILLHLLWNDPSQPGVFAGKLFEYLGARRPILSVGQTQSVAADLIRERCAGVALDDQAQIAEQLAHWIRLKEQQGMIPSLDASATQGLSREEQTRKLESFLYERLKTTATSPANSENGKD